MRIHPYKRLKKKWPLTIVVALAAALVLSLGVGFLARQLYQNNLKPVNANQKQITITIESGSSLKEIAKLLKDRGLIRSALAFEQYVRNAGLDQSLKAGTYALQPSQSVPQIVEVLTHGKILTNLLTIPPDRRIDEIRQIFIDHGYAPSAVDRALQPNAYRGHPALVDIPSGVISLEGYLYPESFQKTADTRPEDIIRRSLDEMQKRLTPELRALISQQGLSVYDGIKLASIVEREVSKTEDRTQVAQVFLKRLRSNIPLGADITAPYGAIIDGQIPSLTYDSAYNTHLHMGLPSTPISNVTDSSLQAVARPAPTDWLYFVSGDDGVTYFSKTQQEHEALTAQHCKQLCSNN